MSEFLNMGGYALYVWPCFVVSALVLTTNALLPSIRRKQLLKQLRAEQQRRALRAQKNQT